MIARMTNPEREDFLAEPRVAVISIAAPDRAPVTVPIGYHYVAGGEVGLWMDGSSYQGPLTARDACTQPLRAPRRATLPLRQCVQRVPSSSWAT